MIRERVEYLSAGQDVETDEQDVVCQQHEGSEYIGYLALSKGVVSEITCSHYEIAHSVGSRCVLTDVPDMRVLHDEFVHGDRGNPEEHSGEQHSYNSGDPSQHTERTDISIEICNTSIAHLRQRPRLRHNSQTHLVTSQQPRGLLP